MSTTVRPFRFGVQAFNAPTPQAWRDLARRTEDLGYSAFHLADHYIGGGPQLAKTNHPLQTLGSIPAMAVAAEATSTIRIGCRVFCVDYHVPAVLVKHAMTIDWFSGGRLEFGLGAGWLAGEYEAMGVSLDPPGVRVGRLEEMVQLTRALMAPGEVDHHGTHITTFGFQGEPQPIAAPPPIMVGGGSSRVLAMAGRLADIVSINFDNSSGVIGPVGVNSGKAAATEQKVQWVADGATAAGRDLPELEIAAYFTFVVDQPAVVAERFGAAFGMTADDVLEHPHALVGTVDGICDELVRRRELYGISYVTVGDSNLEAFAPVVARLAGT
jgi:probable F420-dependent oxidoreductase